MNPNQASRPVENRILAALPAQDRDRMLANLEPISMPLGGVLYEASGLIDYVYFIESGMVSLVALTEEGETFEVAVVGFGGMVGSAVFLDEETSQHRTIVQAEGTALRMKTTTFKAECDGMANLQTLLRRYCSALFRQITQSAVCCRFHTTEARLCRWLLQTRDCARSNNLYLTQEFLAQMLGIYRPGVTLAAGMLQNAGLVRYSRGHITIVDPEGLEASSCECYKVITDAYNSIFARKLDPPQLA
jgi:CRP-like cAMP-binding protein